MNNRTYYQSKILTPLFTWMAGVSIILIGIAAVTGQEKEAVTIQGGQEAVKIVDEKSEKFKDTETKTPIQSVNGEKVQENDIIETTTATTTTADLNKDGVSERYLVLTNELNIINTEKGPLLRLAADVLFDFDKTSIKPSAEDTLDKVAELIMLSGDNKVEVAGYADAIGSKEYNAELAWNRALAVVEWFKNREGMRADRFRAIGRGEEGAVAPNTKVDGSDNPKGRKLNRRVEILIRDQTDVPEETPELK